MEVCPDGPTEKILRAFAMEDQKPDSSIRGLSAGLKARAAIQAEIFREVNDEKNRHESCMHSRAGQRFFHYCAYQKRDPDFFDISLTSPYPGDENGKKLIGKGMKPMEGIRKYQVCSCCVMDTTDEGIQFDENGVCMRCNEYKDRILPDWNHGYGHEKELAKLIDDIKKSGEGKPYDCILGISGGLDSSYMLHLAVKEWGLRPFVFHIDTGWNLPVAESNLKKMTDKLGIELHIEKMDWNEMREMQLAFLRTGLRKQDVPQDHAFIALIDKYAMKLGVKYIFNGYNIATEVVSDPRSWGKGGGPTSDEVFVKDVLRKYCRIPIRHYTFTNGVRHKFIIPYVLGVKTVKPLNLVPFTKEEMIETLKKEYDYEPYGQKHFEDLLTKFLEAWWNPKKYGFDIRKAQLSSLVITGQMTRDEALKILETPPVSEEEGKEMFSEVARRLEISEDELRFYFNLPECTDTFRSNLRLHRAGIRLYEKLGIEKRIRK